LDLSETLVNSSIRFSTSTRAALNTMVTVLSNRLVPSSGSDLADVSRVFTDAYKGLVNPKTDHDSDVSTSVAIFQSALHFLAGKLANYRGSDDNSLLQLICDTATVEASNGRQLAQCFEILVSPKECLAKENHALVKRLSGQWIYRQTVSPYLAKCFPAVNDPSNAEQQPEPSAINPDQQATNRSVAVFAILKHTDYAIWQGDAAQIVRVAIRSQTKFGASADLNTVLDILLTVLDRDPGLLQSHLKSLVSNALAVYQLALDAASSRNPTATALMSKRAAASCRKSCLQFIARLPGTSPFEPRHLLPQRSTVVRSLSHACGDPVREVREVAIKGRRAWDALS
jgi:DNA repair/transcription protein MET18/MMS19